MQNRYNATNVYHTYRTTDARNTALRFSAILAADKGVPNELQKEPKGYLVVSDDGKAVRFIQT